VIYLRGVSVLEGALTWIMVAGLSFVAFVALLAFWERKIKGTGRKAIVGEESSPPKLDFTSLRDQVKKARKELRSLKLEREVLRHAIRRLYEAEIDGEIDEEDGRRLVEKYKNEVREIEENIAKNQVLVTLYDQMEPHIKQEPIVISGSKEREEEGKPLGLENTEKTETDEKIEAIEKEVLETLKALRELEVKP